MNTAGNHIERIEAEIAKAEKRAQHLRQILAMAREDVSLLEALFESREDDQPTLTIKPSQLYGGSNGDRSPLSSIRAFFTVRGNKWASAPQIMKGTGLKRGTVSHTLYTRHSDEFEKMADPDSKNGKLWRIVGK